MYSGFHRLIGVHACTLVVLTVMFCSSTTVYLLIGFVTANLKIQKEKYKMLVCLYWFTGFLDDLLDITFMYPQILIDFDGLYA